MKRTTLWLLGLLLFVACNPGAPAVDSTPVSELVVTGVADTAPTAAPPTSAPTATAEPTETTLATSSSTIVPASTLPASEATPAPTIVATPTETPLPTMTSTATPMVVVSGRTEEGAFFLGAPDAPVTMIDYSDFL